MQGLISDARAPGGVRMADDLPEPEPGDEELVVELRATSVNRGELASLERNPNGWRPGQDLAGVVVRAARNGEGPPEAARVVAILERGSWSERSAVPAHLAAELADGVSFEHAACLPLAGLTALRVLRVDGPLLGRRVLVTGATGGVGHLCVQLAAAAGARVTAHVSGPEREDEARALGAHEVVWSLDDAALGPYELVADAIGGDALRDAVHLLAPGGTAATYGALGGPAPPGLGDFGRAPGARVVDFFHRVPPETRGDDLAVLAGLVADGRLSPRVGLVRDWTETAAVLEALRRREVRGKAVPVRR